METQKLQIRGFINKLPLSLEKRLKERMLQDCKGVVEASKKILVLVT